MAYIDREALKKAFIADKQHLQSFDSSLFELLMIEIDEAPSADVSPVRHGRWLDGKCTVCGWEEPDVCTWSGYDAESWIETPYCPNCGCKIDGGEPDA